MKKLLLVLLTGLSLAACIKEKDNNEITGPEPMPEKVLSRDTIKSGQLWGFAIGQTSAQVYAKAQEISVERKIAYMSVVGNVFTSLEPLENKIPLYTTILLDQTIGTGTGIQIYFADNKVKSMWTNDGVQMGRWPVVTGSNSSIAVEDHINDVYAKLVNIKKISAYANKFERISMFDKDFSKAYDPQMAASRLWYVNGNIDDKQYYRLELNFVAGKLVSIYSALLEK
ncbi:hypothetical protein [Mucilaginibacter terrae]|uniref:Lipoprotein n=1 Tax=Mucilaginibacter terrae TaxID=1955052 RepID=A0ABU3GWT1_9SPHI|nr:hypothetical protein [Mucilaginibacter terrae]MDT3404221.1 hypothetical protein [Mucilaginibacter terrae]